MHGSALPRPRSGAGPALFRLVRFWARRWASGAAGSNRKVGHVLVVEALATAPEATIAGVARQVGVDRSVASRMAGEAESAGYVVRRTDARDARKVVLAHTTEGRTLLAEAHAWQDEVFSDLTADWTSEDRERFATYLVRLARQVGA
jgi:DNA-binding MarR family transcriptional regulator